MIDDHAGHREPAQPVDANVAPASRRAEPNRFHGPDQGKADARLNLTWRTDQVQRCAYAGGNSLRDFQHRVRAGRGYNERRQPLSQPTHFAEHSDGRSPVSSPPCAERVFSAAAGATLVALLMASRRVTAAGACERLRGLTLPGDATVTEARAVSPNTKPFFAPRAFCRVFVTIAPTADSDIKAEVWLPVDGWNQKFQAVGNGDAAGVISYDAMVEAIRRGYATSSTDTGHVGNTMAFALGHRDKYVDFGYRAVHEMTVTRENHRRSVLRHGAGALVLERLLAGRPSRHHRSDPLPSRLRRDYRGGSGDRAHAAARGAAGVEQVRAPLQRQLHSAREIPGDSPCGAERVRRARRRRTTA